MKKIELTIKSQPDYTSCGPTSLHALYKFWGDSISIEELLKDVPQFDEGGGTLAVTLGIDALKRGYKAAVYSFNLNIFDPTWFELPMPKIKSKLLESLERGKLKPKEKSAVKNNIQFIDLGGELRFANLSEELIAGYLSKNIPILTGLSSSWLYKTQREDPITSEYDDILGKPAGHFVVLHGYNSEYKEVDVADPYKPNPISGTNYYKVPVGSLINSILLGVMSYDGNLLIVEKKSGKK